MILDPPKHPATDAALAEGSSGGTERRWRELVEGVLKGKPFQTLVGRTADGIELQPLYSRYAGAAHPALGRRRGWDVVARVDHPDPRDANAAAKIALQNGATALSLVFAGGVGAYGFGVRECGPAAMDVLFDGIELDADVPVTLDAGADAAAAAVAVADCLGRRKVQCDSADVQFCIDPLGAAVLRGFLPQPWPESARQFAAALVDLAARGFKGPACIADGRIVHNACGSEAQELAFTLACALAYLRALEAAGLSLDAARRLIGFRLAADADQFVTMAKFRAMRLLWAQVEDGCGLASSPMALGAETAWRMMARRDPWANVLRTTLALVAAGLGGADSITVLPHTQVIGLPDDFARRLARNAQLIMLNESNLDKVADPAAGSGGIEALTDRLAETAWTLFQAIESRGGIWQDLLSGAFQGEVLRMRAKREAEVATLQAPLMGTSMFPLLDEKPVAVLEAAPIPGPAPPIPAGVATVMPLPAIRLAEPFERVRYFADIHTTRTGKRPGVFLANLGQRKDFLARADFAQSVFGAGGFEASPKEASHDDREALLDSFARSAAKVACLCGSDSSYTEHAHALVKELRDRGATGVFVAGEPGQDETKLRQAGLTRYLFPGCDVVDVLAAAHDAL